MPVEMRTTLMHLLNIEARIMKVSEALNEFYKLLFRGDTNTPASQLYPLKVGTLREILNDPSLLKGKRSEVRGKRRR